MRGSGIARNYAEAYFELAERQRQQETFGEALEQVASLLDTQPRFRLFIESPKLDAEKKKEVLRNTFGGRVPPLVLNFLFVVLDKRRQRIIRDIAHEYRALLDERLGRLHVQVTLAREPDERAEREIADHLSRVLGKTVIPHVRVNPQILGGIVVRYGDRVLDGSVRRRLLSLRRRLLEAGTSR